MALEAGHILNNRYRIIKLLGQGGFGEVYQAWDMRLEGYCAVKRNLQPAPEVRKQFEQEARMLFKLRHPSLPIVHDYFVGVEDDQYLVMDFVEGEDLRARLIRSGHPAVEQVLTWLEQVCDALTYLHSRQPPVVHRDIKPANIIITSEGQAMLVDFGIAKSDPQMRTLSGARAWSPGFAPPEQYGQGRTDAQSDVYSLGATAYALLTGESPPDAMDIAAGEKQPATPAHIINPNVPKHVSQAIERAMQLSRAQRTLTAAEFRQALRKRPEPVPRVEIIHEEEDTIHEPQEKTGLKVLPSPSEEQPIRSKQQPSLKNLNWRWIAGILIGAVILFILARTLWNLRGAQPSQGAVPPDNDTRSAVSQQLEEEQQAAGEEQAAQTPDMEQANDVSPTDPSNPPACTAIGQSWTSPIDGMSLVCVPDGEFNMGSEDGEYDEKPVHKINLDAFWIDQTEVTNAMYAKFVEETGHPNVASSQQGNADHPVTLVDWNDATAYCQWALRQLPSEAQWEKAARGTDGRPYPWGSQDPDCTLANSSNPSTGYDCVGETQPVGSYPAGASPYGALDMAGNTWEWVADWYKSDYFSNSPARNPTGPEDGSYKVARGGCWSNGKNLLRTSTRTENNPGSATNDRGFRCAVLPGSQ
jgi:eukaryotic-like serine/threonine-protein kinase